MDKIENEIAREPYESPVVEDIPLRTDEQLLAGCKIAPHPGPATQICGQGVGRCSGPIGS